jgi:hypothetical protein
MVAQRYKRAAPQRVYTPGSFLETKQMEDDTIEEEDKDEETRTERTKEDEIPEEKTKVNINEAPREEAKGEDRDSKVQKTHTVRRGNKEDLKRKENLARREMIQRRHIEEKKLSALLVLIVEETKGGEEEKYVNKKCKEAIGWLSKNHLAEAEKFREKRAEIEDIMPAILKIR